MSVTLRATKGSPLTTAEADANFSGLADGSNWESAVVAPSVSLSLEGASGNDRIFGAGQATINGTVNRYVILGYNITKDGASSVDTTDSTAFLAFESNYNDGATRFIEYHVDLAAPGGSSKRPFMAAMALTGSDAGKITEAFMLADGVNGQISFYSGVAVLQAAATFTTGAQFKISSLDTGGKIWNLVSTGSGAGLGAGKFLIFNTSDSEYLLVGDANQNVGLGGATTFGTNAAGVLALKNNVVPTTGPADTVQFYSSDNSAGHTIPSFFCEGTEVIATGQADSASSVRVKMRINGTVVTLLAI